MSKHCKTIKTIINRIQRRYNKTIYNNYKETIKKINVKYLTNILNKKVYKKYFSKISLIFFRNLKKYLEQNFIYFLLGKKYYNKLL